MVYRKRDTILATESEGIMRRRQKRFDYETSLTATLERADAERRAFEKLDAHHVTHQHLRPNPAYPDGQMPPWVIEMLRRAYLSEDAQIALRLTADENFRGNTMISLDDHLVFETRYSLTVAALLAEAYGQRYGLQHSVSATAWRKWPEDYVRVEFWPE